MSRTLRAALLLLPLCLATFVACAVRLGSGGPAEYTALVLGSPAGATPQQVAAQVRAAGGQIVLLAAEQDSAWFDDVATQTGLALSGPGTTSGRGLAFLTDLELLGDTSLMLAVPGGGSVHMHDALYRVDRYRDLDLMIVRLDAPDIRAAVVRLIEYISTDVGPAASVLLAVDAATPQLADSVAVLMRAVYASELDCPTVDTAAAARPGIRLLYGPTARLSCRSSRVLPGAPAGVAARIVVN